MNAWTLDAVFFVPLAAWITSFATRELRHVRRLATLAFLATAALTAALGARHAHLSVQLPWTHSGALFTIGAARIPFLLVTAFTAGALVATSPTATFTPSSLRRMMLGFLAVCLAYLSTDFVLQAVASVVVAFITYADLSAAATTRRARGEARLAALVLGASSTVALAGALVVQFTPTLGDASQVFDSFERTHSSHFSLYVVSPLVASMLVRLAPFPFHGWLPASLELGSLGSTSMTLLAQPAAMMALHAAMPRASDNGGDLPAWSLAVTITCIVAGAYTALAAIAQHDLRRALGYVASSQNALALAGLVTGTLEGGVASVLFSLAVAITTVGLLVVAHALEARAGKVDAHAQLGFAKTWPRLGAAFLLLALATIGFPGSVQFFAEDLLLQGLIEAHPYTAHAVLVVSVLNGITLLRLFIGLFFGAGARRRADEYVAPDMRLRELAGPAALLGLMVSLVSVVPALGALIER